MFMKSLENLRNYLKTNTINTITVDIFDTILLRRVWPEGLQFIEAAKRSVSIFQASINENITPFEIYSWREYVRQEILDGKRQDPHGVNDVDLNLEEWFTELYSVLHAKYNGKSAKITKKDLSALIGIEMQLEKEYTQSNTRLIDTLRTAKNENPKLKIFFASDMYLTTKQVEGMLEHHNILDLFDGGITSTDAGNAKHSGRLYYHMHTLKDGFKDVKLPHNLHIGDSYHSDVEMARIAGSASLHYHHTRLRRVRTLAGRVQLKLIKMRAFKKEAKHYKKSLAQSRAISNNKNRHMHDLGFLFSQPMGAYLLHVGLMATYTKNKRYIFASSEASTFVDAGKKLFGDFYDTPEAAIKLNRKRSISAVAWTIITKNDPTLITKLIKTVRYGEIGDNRKELYDFLLTSDFGVNEAEINAMPTKKFYQKLHEDLQSAEAKFTKHLKDDYTYVKSTLPKDGSTVVICDVGWGGTVQAVYTVFAELHDYKGDVEGVYLGVHPPTRFGLGELPMVGYLLPNVLNRKYRPYWSAVIWEYVYTNKFQFEGDETRLAFVSQGLDAGYEHFRTVHINPKDYFDHVIRGKIKRLLRHPTNDEVASIGEIRYDFGFNDPQILRIVDTEYPRLKFWGRLLLKPKSTISMLVAPNNWTGGYIKRYNLIGVPTLLKILGRLKRTYYL